MSRSNDGETRISLESLICGIAMFDARIHEALQKQGTSLDYDTYSGSISGITHQLKTFVNVFKSAGGPKLVEQTAGVIARISNNSSPTLKSDCEIMA